MLMGSSDTFTGFGVLFDTYANDELHRDVVVVASKNREQVLLSSGKDFPGCEMKFRRWEGRQDFSVEQESIAKITLLGNRVVVEVDAMGQGDFKKCVDKDMTKYLPADSKWRQNAHFAISATTGALHDNHDVLEVITTEAEQFDRLMEIHDDIIDSTAVEIAIENANLTAADIGHHVNSLAYEVKFIDDKLSTLHHEIEHEVEKVGHRLEDLIDSIRNQEKRLEVRVTELERKISAELLAQLETRLQKLEQEIYRNMDGRQQVITRHVGATFTAAQDEAKTWRVPFMIFAFVIVVALAYLIWSVVRINKKVGKEIKYFD